MDSLPTEILSEILIHAINTFGDDVRLKWRFPLLFRRVSKRFYYITTTTRALWRYLYIRQSLHPYLHHHITHSGTLSLVLDVTYNVEPGELSETCTEITNLILSICSRLTTLVLYSPSSNKPITEILHHAMPTLKFLDIEGANEGWVQTNFPRSHFPNLRSLRSSGFFDFNSDVALPDTLEELYFADDQEIDTRAWGNLWAILPPRLRVFRSGNIVWNGVLSTAQTVHLPCLADLDLTEICLEGELSILQCLEARALHTLSVNACYQDDAMTAVWLLACPALTHLEWISWPTLPLLGSILRECKNIKSLHIKLGGNSQSPEVSISEFMEVLASDTSLLPLLDDVVVHGASIPSLRRLVQARPWLKSVKIHWKDLGLDSTRTYLERKGWLEAQIIVEQSQAVISCE